jgi:enoyl-CoA hydratase/carnithine racemase
MSGTEAVSAGLFSRVVPDDEVVDATVLAATTAARGATAAFLASKQLVARIRDERLGLWVSAFDAIGLQAAQQSIKTLTRAAPAIRPTISGSWCCTTRFTARTTRWQPRASTDAG